MKISGNQTAVKEIMNLLDPDFIPPFMCTCYGRTPSNIYISDQGLDQAHWCECYEQNYWHEENFGLNFYLYELEYDGDRIIKCKELNAPHSASSGKDNILNGCVR